MISWIICDFGSASFWRKDKLDSDLISTRPYRAPEVVLGNKWHHAADMWSMGCILYEIAVGHRLFEVHEENTHLQLMEKRLGKLPDLFTRHSRYSHKFFNARGDFSTVSESIRHGKSRITPLKDVFRDDPAFYRLLSSLLIYDPGKRATAFDALQRSVFNELRKVDEVRDNISLSGNKVGGVEGDYTEEANKLDMTISNIVNSVGNSAACNGAYQRPLDASTACVTADLPIPEADAGNSRSTLSGTNTVASHKFFTNKEETPPVKSIAKYKSDTNPIQKPVTSGALSALATKRRSVTDTGPPKSATGTRRGEVAVKRTPSATPAAAAAWRNASSQDDETPPAAPTTPVVLESAPLSQGPHFPDDASRFPHATEAKATSSTHAMESGETATAVHKLPPWTFTND